MAVLKRSWIARYFTWQNAAYAIAFIGFLSLATITGSHHEPWADEAQAWLIARDSTYWDIIVKYARYEGTPCLWHLILKTLILSGFRYQYLYLVSVFFSALGVFLFLFQSKFPAYLKITFPFTYFVLYQFTVVARSYCLILPALCFVAIIYEKRFLKPWLYSIALLLLSQICIYTLLIAGLLFVFYLKDLYKLRKEEGQGALHKSTLWSLAMVALGFLLTALYVFPPSDLSFRVDSNFNPLIVIAQGIQIAAASLVGTTSSTLSMIAGGCLFIFMLLFLNKEYKSMKPLLFLVITLTVFISIVHFNFYHAGILYVTLVLAFWIFGGDDFFRNAKEKKQLLLFGALLCVALVQIYWSVCSVKNDISNPYSAAKETATFLEENTPEDGTVYGLGVWTTAIEPYFDENIFDNYNSDKAFYMWSKQNGYMNNAEMISSLPDIAVVSNHEKEDYAEIISCLIAQGYKSEPFSGSIYMKDATWSEEGFTVYYKSQSVLNRQILG